MSILKSQVPPYYIQWTICYGRNYFCYEYTGLHLHLIITSCIEVVGSKDPRILKYFQSQSDSTGTRVFPYKCILITVSPFLYLYKYIMNYSTHYLLTIRNFFAYFVSTWGMWMAQLSGSTTNWYLQLQQYIKYILQQLSHCISTSCY